MIDELLHRQGDVGYWATAGPQQGYSFVVDDTDEVAAWAFLLKAGRIIADVWLYNRCPTPIAPPWKTPGARPPFPNPAGLSLPDNARVLLEDCKDVRARWGEDGDVQLICDGVLWARLWPGATPGQSRMAADDGPNARRLPNASR